MPGEYSEGWLDLPEQREALAKEMRLDGRLEPVRDIPLVGAPVKDRFLWLDHAKVSGLPSLPWNQGAIGSCVAHGFGLAVDFRLATQIIEGIRESWPADSFCRESLYGLSRVQVGKQRPGSPDGSTGIWAAKALTDFGHIRYRKYPFADLKMGYSVERCRTWGSRGSPAEARPYESEHRATSISQVTKAVDAARLIRQGIPVAVCSNQGFSMKRGPGGYCEATGSWAHCMCIVGVFSSKAGSDDFVIANSWGDYLGSANNTIASASNVPTELPPGYFCARGDVVNRMLAQGDSYSINRVNGYARKWWPFG